MSEVDAYDVEVEKRLVEDEPNPNCSLCRGTGFFYMGRCACVGYTLSQGDEVYE